MAYTSQQKKDHIYEVQSLLHTLSYVIGTIPTVIPDGYFDNETSIAVRAFQREYGLRETGTVNSETWNEIVRVYLEHTGKEPSAYDIFPSDDYSVGYGDTGLLVYIIEAMLNDIAKGYDNFKAVEVDGVFGENDIEALKHFLRRAGLSETEKIDSMVWNRLSSASSHLNKSSPLR